MELNKVIQEETDKLIAEKLPTMVEEKANKLLNSILDDVFRSYSDLGKSIKEKIENQLDVNLQKFDLVDYNAMISKSINDSLIKNINEGCINPIKEMVSKTVGIINKKEQKLSEIVDWFKETSMEDSDCDDYEGEISLHIEENEEREWYIISIDPEKNKEKKECALEFYINKNGSIFIFRAKTYWSGKDRNLTPTKITQLSSLEHKIFRLYSAQVKIIVDDTDEYWSKHD